MFPLVAKIAAKKLPKALLKPPKSFKKANVKDFKDDMQRLGEEIAEDFKDTVIENIETNYYKFELAHSTIMRKNSGVPLIDTHQMVDAIYREDTEVSVKDSLREDSSLTNKELAIIHEYGTKDKHIPARPVWRNTFRDFKNPARTKIERFLKTHKFKGNVDSK